MIQKEEVVRIGYFAKTHGIKGELSLMTDFDLFEDDNDPYLICDMDGIWVPFFIESVRCKGSASILIKLIEVDNEKTAKKFVGQEVFYPANRMTTLSNEDLTWKRLTGYVLEDEKLGELGVITDVDQTTINTLFKVDYQGKELLTPVADELVVSIDKMQKKIIVSLPDGIIDLI